MIGILVNVVVLTVICWIAIQKEDEKEYLSLISIPLALSILAFIAEMIIGNFYFVIILIIAVYIIKWGFDIAMPKAIIAAVIWTGWLLLFPVLIKLYLNRS